MNSIFKELAQFFSGLWNKSLEPWLMDLGHRVEHDVVSGLVPLAHEAIGDVLATGATLFDGTQSIETKAQNLAQLVLALGKRAATTTLTVTEHDFMTSLAGALATASTQKPAA